jgi:hypothetical protein
MKAVRSSTVVEISTLKPKIWGLNPAAGLVPFKQMTDFDRKSLKVNRLLEKM